MSVDRWELKTLTPTYFGHPFRALANLNLQVLQNSIRLAAVGFHCVSPNLQKQLSLGLMGLSLGLMGLSLGLMGLSLGLMG
jgi:hypothetical protein